MPTTHPPVNGLASRGPTSLWETRRPTASARTLRATGLIAVMLLGLAGCETRYDLRFRPTDTTTQRTLRDVNLTLTRSGAQTPLGRTDPHGQIDTTALRPGDRITFTAPGYTPTILTVATGRYYVRTSEADPMMLDLRSGDAIPIPMHRN